MGNLGWKFGVDTLGRVSLEKASFTLLHLPSYSSLVCLPLHPAAEAARSPSHLICLPSWVGGLRSAGTVFSPSPLNTSCRTWGKATNGALGLGPLPLCLPFLNTPALYSSSIHPSLPTIASPLLPPQGCLGREFWGLGCLEPGLKGEEMSQNRVSRLWGPGRGSGCWELREMLPTLQKHCWMDGYQLICWSRATERKHEGDLWGPE